MPVIPVPARVLSLREGCLAPGYDGGLQQSLMLVEGWIVFERSAAQNGRAKYGRGEGQNR